MFSVKFCLLFLSVLASLAVGYIIEKTSADGPWSSVLESKNKNYFVALTPTFNYNDSKAICEKYNLRPLTIESKEEYTQVIDLLTNEVDYLFKIFWTAGTRLQGQKVLDYWIWETTQENITFFDWGTEEPEGDNQNCIQLTLNQYSNGTWNSFFCRNFDITAYPVCETF